MVAGFNDSRLHGVACEAVLSGLRGLRANLSIAGFKGAVDCDRTLGRGPPTGGSIGARPPYIGCVAWF